MPFDLDSIIRHGADWRLEIVLKIAENCNLACDYCYFYFRGNDSHSRHSALITEETVTAFLAFLRRVTTTTDFGLIQIDFHGGEPLLYPKERFDALCSGIRESVAGNADLILNVQTNGTLVDAEWVELFSKHNVIVGISLDGPAAVHDLHRFDKKGRGSHAATVRGLRLLQDAAAKGLLAQEPGVLCVYGFGTPIEELKRHFVDELGVRQFNILLDDATHDTWQRPEGFRADLFSTIAPHEANGSGAMVPAIMRAEHQLQMRAFSKKLAAYDQVKNVIITVSSDGDISAADQVRICGDDFCYDALNVRDADLRSILTSRGYAQQAQAYDAIPDECGECCWRNLCRGGELVHRFSAARGFNNPSIYCEVLQDLYASTAARLINGGRTVNQIERALGLPAEEMA